MMNKCKLFIILATISTLVFSCKKKDEAKLSDDPRLRRVRLTDFPDYYMVVNDIEGKIFNYDSLPYGTNIDSFKFEFYAYESAPINIWYSYNDEGVLTKYSSAVANRTTFDMSNKVQLVSYSEDGQHSKSYDLELRVHKFDVDAFRWIESGTIDIDFVPVTQKSAILDDQSYYWFVTSEDGDSRVYSSVDGENWSYKNISESLDCRGLSVLTDTLYVMNTNGKLLKSHYSDLSFSEINIDGYSISKILFAMNNSLWFITENNNLIEYNPSTGKVKTKVVLNKDFPVNDIIPFTSMSGYTTLGYIMYGGEKGTEIWAIDKNGKTAKLLGGDGSLPSIHNPLLFSYETTLGLIGGVDNSGNILRKCYISPDCGITWKRDWHKDLIDEIGTLASSGVFVTNSKGELIVLGGMNNDGVSNKIYKGRLQSIVQKEDFWNSIGK